MFITQTYCMICIGTTLVIATVKTNINKVITHINHELQMYIQEFIYRQRLQVYSKNYATFTRMCT